MVLPRIVLTAIAWARVSAFEGSLMKRHVPCALLLLVCSACMQDASQSTNPTGPSPVNPLVTPAASSAVSVPLNFRAHLTGHEVVPAVETRAQGQAVLQVSADGTALYYLVTASNIENVTGAHIHLGAAGAGGPNVAFLLGPLPPARGRTDGVLVKGTITSANLVNVLAGQPLSALIDAIEAGNAYVDVPTNDGMAPPFTGPGDFVTGEIRGQLH
jgi:CHRD domain-containing protein